jgi:hypothetical protein
MFLIPITAEEVKEIPKIKEWIQNMNLISFDQSKVDIDDIEFHCSFGYFVPKSHNSEDKFMDIFEMTSNMHFEERFNYELSKVRVNILLKWKKFSISDRLPKGVIPTSVFNLVKELTKVKMTLEFESHGKEEIKKTIPEIDTSLVNIETFNEVASSEIKKDFNIDDILDKISEKGISSLSDDEKEFLDSKSKE